jgi:hypothetical protein
MSAEKSTPAAKKRVLVLAWANARREIFPALAELLHTHTTNRWVKVSDLFNAATLPANMTVRNVAPLWKTTVEDGLTRVYASDDDDLRGSGYLLFRHPFGASGNHLWGCHKSCRNSLDELIEEAVDNAPRAGQTAIGAVKMDKVRQPFIVVLRDGLGNVRLIPNTPPLKHVIPAAETRGDFPS